MIHPLGRTEVQLLRVLLKEHGPSAVLVALSDCCLEARQPLYASMITDAARLIYVSSTTKGKPARGKANPPLPSGARRGSKGPR